MRSLIFVLLLGSPIFAQARINWFVVQQNLLNRFSDLHAPALNELIEELSQPTGSAIYLAGPRAHDVITELLAMLRDDAHISVVQEIRDASNVHSFLRKTSESSVTSLLVWRDLHKWYDPHVKQALHDFAQLLPSTRTATKLIVEENGTHPLPSTVLEALHQIDLKPRSQQCKDTI